MMDFPTGFDKAWFAEDGEIFITFTVQRDNKCHSENHPLKSPAAEGWIRRTLRNKLNRAPHRNELENYRCELESLAYEQNIRFKTYLRTGEHEDKIYIDIGNADWQAIEIDADGWRIVDQAPIPFRRNAHMGELPMPKKNGSLEVLKDFACFRTREDFLLYASFLICSFHPSGPYFHLMLVGEKGSAKSSLARLTQTLLHPSSSSSKGLPKDEDNLVIDAYHNRFVMIDNENDLGKWVPNALCRLATGTGIGNRTQYTNRDQMAFSVARPCIITAHIIPSKQEDLIERCLIAKLNCPKTYLTERNLKMKLEKNAGKILGAILNIISISLKHAQDLVPESLNLHRMADASYFIACAAQEIGWDSIDEFLNVLNSHQATALASPWATDDALKFAVINVMAERDILENTPSNILEALKQVAQNPFSLPKDAANLTKRLNKLSNYFVQNGLHIETGIRSKGGTQRLIRITKNGLYDTKTV